jgi:hypothetical protein
LASLKWSGSFATSSTLVAPVKYGGPLGNALRYCSALAMDALIVQRHLAR